MLDVAWGRGKTEIEGEESLGANFFLAPTSLLKMAPTPNKLLYQHPYLVFVETN
jgi:hypothetical protein